MNRRGAGVSKPACRTSPAASTWRRCSAGFDKARPYIAYTMIGAAAIGGFILVDWRVGVGLSLLAVLRIVILLFEHKRNRANALLKS